MSYTASASIARVKAKGFVSTVGSLTDAEVLEWLNDSLRSHIVPFLKVVRDEWFVTGSEDVTPDSNARIAVPNSIASTIRTITWDNNGQQIPLARIEPERAYAYSGVNASNQPYGYMLRGYEIQILPTNIGSVTVQLTFMERPAEMVLEESAAQTVFNVLHPSATLTLDSVPLAWQSSTPTYVDIVSGTSPFMTLVSTAAVTSLTGSTLVLQDVPDVDEVDVWVTDVGTNPFPAVPVEFHPLLQRSVITELYAGTGDKRLDGSVKLQMKLEDELRRTMAPRTQGTPRPIVNRNAPGMGTFRRWGW